MGRGIDELVGNWNAAIAASSPAELHERMRARMRCNGLTYGDRVVCQVLRPCFLPRHRYERILETSGLVLKSLHAAARLIGARPGLAEWLGFDATERRLISIGDDGRPQDLIARLDSCLDPAGEPVFMEYNGESPGGIGFGDGLGEAFESLPIFARATSGYRLTRRPVVPEVVSSFKRHYVEWAENRGAAPAPRPSVAIVDFADVPTRSEFSHFISGFEAAGMAAAFVDPSELDLEGDQVLTRGKPVDIIYRRLLTPDLFARHPKGQRVVEIMTRDLCFVANGFGGHALSNKGLFALLSDPARRPTDLDAEQVRAIDRSIPWTRLAASEATFGPESVPQRVEPLDEIVRREKNRLVLKPAGGYGGQGVVLGWRVSEAA